MHRSHRPGTREDAGPRRRTGAVAAGFALVVVAAAAAPGTAAAPQTPPTAAAQQRAVRTAVALPFSATVTPVTAADLGASWRPGCPVGPGDLRLLTFSAVDLQGRPGIGRLVVHRDVADPLVRVFADLHAQRFGLASVRPVSEFGGDDDASMAADNTSAFNCRATTGGTGFSEHSYGTAVDVNPVENPYVKGSTVLPAAGRAHLTRTPAPGRVLAGDAVVQAFERQGFSWGGAWRSLKDYQHFSRSGG